MFAAACLVLAILLLGVGLLAVFRAPTLPLVFLAVGATELGQWFALGAMGVAVVAPRDGAPGITAAVLALLVAGLLLSPAVRAMLQARRIRESLGAFGDVPPVFSAATLFRLPASHRVSGERFAADGVPFDFYRANSAGPAPLVVVVHGGGWMAGAAGELAAWNCWLVRRGCAVAAVEYRLVPAAVWPSQRDEVLAVIAHLRARAGEFGVDPDRIVLLGRSAGGQIASAIAAAPDQPWLRGCVCLYSPFDMGFAYEHGREDDVLRSRWLLRSYLGGTPEERPEAYREASAYETVTATSPPFLLVHGGRDELVWRVQTERFAARLKERGVWHAFLELPWATHAFDYNLHGPGGQALAAALATFLDRVFCRPERLPSGQKRASGGRSSSRE